MKTFVIIMGIVFASFGALSLLKPELISPVTMALGWFNASFYWFLYNSKD